MRKIIILVFVLTCFINICHAQLRYGFYASYNLNHLNAGITNRKYTKNLSNNGYGFSLLLDYSISNKLYIHTGIGLLQKNYSLRRTDYYEGLYENFTNSYLQYPSFARYSVLRKQKLKLNLNAGAYLAYWIKAKIDGSLPNMFNSKNDINIDGEIYQYFEFVKFSEKYQFSRIKDNRFEFGLISGFDLNYDLTSRISIILMTSYYHSLTDQQKRYMVNQITKKNQTFCLSFGFLTKLP